MSYAVPEKLRKANPDRIIYRIDDEPFHAYGRVHRSLKVEGYLDYLERYVQVTDEIYYGADALSTGFNHQELHAVISTVYGGLGDLQVGICTGKNNKLNALEYHKGSETIIAGTDMLILLGLTDDIDWDDISYDTSRILAFYVPKGTVYELSGRCLHYAPVSIDEQNGFKLVVFLPKGTNENLELPVERQGESVALLAKNKWLIAHADDESFVSLGAHIGLRGENIEINTD
jgi:hypothetical protein